MGALFVARVIAFARARAKLDLMASCSYCSKLAVAIRAGFDDKVN
jgi:hypothetical protein